MVQYFPSITPEHEAWILAQAVFFVASAPTFGRHVNVSPKGLPSSSLAILGPNEAAYVDATGSGNETISHVRENGRVTVMLCSFDATPRIYRMFCRGRVVESNEPEFVVLLSRMGMADKCVAGARAIIHLDVFLAQTSCGYGVPRLAITTDPTTQEPKPYLQDRQTLAQWAHTKDATDGLETYRQANNAESLDGLPGLRTALRRQGRGALAVEARIWLSRHRRQLELVGAALLGATVTAAALWQRGFLVANYY
ncbi:hypothetical protein VTO42DRAFT_2405 [Malbranchea cinnamomea]